jgi:hypothetical protein
MFRSRDGARPSWGPLIVALIPFVVSFRSVTTVNGVVTSWSDPLAVVLGGVAIVWGLFSLSGVWGMRTPPYDATYLLPVAVPTAAVLIGVIQVLRGLGACGSDPFAGRYGSGGESAEMVRRGLPFVAAALLAVAVMGCSTTVVTQHIEITPPAAAPPGPNPFGGDACGVLTAADFGRLNETVTHALRMDSNTCSYGLAVAGKTHYLMFSDFQLAPPNTWSAVKEHATTYWADSFQAVAGIGDDAYTCVCGTQDLVVEYHGFGFSIQGGTECWDR